MKAKLSLLTTVVASAFSLTVNAGQMIDHGAMPANPEALKAEVMKKLSPERFSQFQASSENPTIIDLTVWFNPSYLEHVSEALTFEADGKPIENGAQFALRRTIAQIDGINQIFANQGINAQLRINWVGTIDLPVTKIESIVAPDATQEEIARQYFEHNAITYCINLDWPEGCGYLGYTADDFTYERELFRKETDLVLYVREHVGDAAIGLGGFMSLVSIYDEYKELISYAKSKGSQAVASTQFGDFSFNTIGHEFGHALGANHETTTGFPAVPGKYDRAYLCGPKENGTPTSVDKKRTIMNALAGSVDDPHHNFFSDPDIIVEGDRCGVSGEADNARVLRENASHPYFDLRNPVDDISDVGFTVDTYNVNRSENTFDVRVVRSGDLSQSSFVSLLARDVTAWEGRDFEFGIKELRFGAGESEKTVTVNLLPRPEKHNDGVFNIDIKYAIGSDITFATTEVTVVSSNPAQVGAFELASAAINANEGSQASVVIQRAVGSDTAVSVKIRTVDGTATAGVDYTAIDRVVEFADGQNSVTVNISLTNRTGAQGQRSFTVELSNPTGGAGLNNAVQTVNIADVTPPPPPPASESGSGGSMGWFTLLMGLALLRLRK